MVDLIRWPEAARVDRVIPKERLYSAANAGTALKQRFVDEVQRARWAYKLGEESLRLAPGMFVTEIQVVVVDLKGPNLDNSVLAGIDRAIPSHIVFELRREDGLWVEQAMAAAHTFAGRKTKAASRQAHACAQGRPWVLSEEKGERLGFTVTTRPGTLQGAYVR